MRCWAQPHQNVKKAPFYNRCSPGQLLLTTCQLPSPTFPWSPIQGLESEMPYKPCSHWAPRDQPPHEKKAKFFYCIAALKKTCFFC